jgi:hypothetical protein
MKPRNPVEDKLLDNTSDSALTLAGACSTDEYNCTNGMCIPDSRRCNGERECGGADSSDEAVCDGEYRHL